MFKTDAGLVTFTVLYFGLVIAFFYSMHIDRENDRALCAKSGGIYHGQICLKPDAIIHYK